MSVQQEVEAVGDLVKAISPMITGKPPMVVGAALADLLAMWVAGHQVAGSSLETDELHQQLLDTHMVMVRRLLPVNERIIRKMMGEAS